MKVYHATTQEAARKILSDGFRDVTGTYLTMNEYTGVWISNWPMNDGDMMGRMEAWFEIDIDEKLLANYEWIEDGKPYREWLVSADVLNKSGTTREITEDEADDIIHNIP